MYLNEKTIIDECIEYNNYSSLIQLQNPNFIFLIYFVCTCACVSTVCVLCVRVCVCMHVRSEQSKTFSVCPCLPPCLNKDLLVCPCMCYAS